MLKAFKQYDRECLLAAMCAVAEVDYYEERRKWQPWRAHMNNGTPEFFECCGRLLPEMVPFMWQWGRVMDTSPTIPLEYLTPLPEQALELSGRGVLFLAQRSRNDLSDVSFHAVAFADGQISDSTRGVVMPALEYARGGLLMPRSGIAEWVVIGIVRSGKEKGRHDVKIGSKRAQ